LSEEKEELENKSKQTAEFKEVHDITGTQQHEPSLFPKEAPHLKECFDNFRAQLISLARKVLRSFADYLQLEDKNLLID